MLNREILKHLGEGIFIGIVSAMVVMAFFMPYFSLHSEMNREINHVLMAYNPNEVSVKEIILDDSSLRVVHFEDIRDTAGTIFSPSLLLSKLNGEDSIMFFSSFDYLMNNDVNPGEIMEGFGIQGLYAGFYPVEHPYGEDFLVVVSKNFDNLDIQGEIRDWNMNEGYKTNFLPRGFRGGKLLFFLTFTGSLYLIFGICGLLIETPFNYIKDNFLRMVVVSVSVVIAILTYGNLFNNYSYHTILWASIIAICSNVLMVLPLLIIWFGKKTYKKV